MPDTIYNDLKEQGLILSQGVEIGFPPIRAPKKSLLSQLTTYILPQPKFQQLEYQLILVPILSNCFVVGRCNTLMCFKYEINKENSKPIIARPHIIHLPFKVDKIHICDSKFLNDRGEIPFVVQSTDILALYYVDLKQSKILERNSLKYSNTLSVRFICEKEFLIMTKQHQIHHIVIQSGKMKLKNKIDADLKIDKDLYVRQIDILGNIDEEQESTVCLFYYLKIKGNEHSQILKVKEYERDLDGRISAKKDFVVLNTQHSVVLGDSYTIFGFQGYYCILLKHEILILKKKFERYLFIDNVMEKIGGNTLKLHNSALVTSHSGNSMEVNIILFNDPKCNSKLLDNIEIDPELSEGFMTVWPFKNDKDTSLMFVFQKQKRLALFNLIKMDPKEKMLMVVENTPKEKITVVQEIAVNLGINKKDFYLNQWVHSSRELADINQFLLPCADVYAIKKELRMTMRRKKIQVSQLLKILEKLGRIIKQELKSSLSQNFLKEYIKNDFLLRKIKLKQASKRMDHRQMDKVYHSSLIDMFVQIVKNDLYPSQKQLDPLHAMVEAPIKEETNLKHVFQEFRMTILENYKRFLINFISQFTPEQIVRVLDNYHFLLPVHEFRPYLIIHQPDYMTEVQLNQMILRTEKTQPQWFSDMTSIQFAREMSRERIEKELHDFYPNSKIHEAINTLVKSEYGIKEKLHKHGLISCTMVEYKQKLSQIKGINLFLKVCQHVNQYNLDSDTPQDDLSSQLVEIFRRKNKLEGKAYETVRLYTSMHRFMLKNNFCEKKVLSAQQLIQLSYEDLVALFFLENRQRKEFIFKEFRGLFVQLYGNPDEFNRVIDRFINSQNCSRIQLEIFINEIKAKGQEFQVQNQELIELIIDGFCKKLEVRQDSDTCRFLEIMEEIQLSKKLGMKVNQVIQVRKCLGVFNLFNCEKESYFDILRYQENNQIFKLLLERYFTQNMKKDFIRIEDEEISLDFCRNMLTVLLYLQENVYYDVTERDLLLTYGQVLIEWKQFEVIKGIIYDEEVLEKLQIEREGFISDLILSVLDQIYIDEEIIYDPETKEHIRNILEIYEGENQIKTQEFAKLELVEIFQSWGTIVHSYDIQTVVYEWSQGNKREFVEDLVNQYIQNLNFDMFRLIYQYLEKSAGRPGQEEDLYTQEFVAYSLFYADKLLQAKMFSEIEKILAFVKQMPEAQISYALLSETFLQCLLLKCSEGAQIESAREAIEYFTQYFKEDERIQRVFETNLESAKYDYPSVQRENSVRVAPTFCFRKQEVSVELGMLWQLAESLYPQQEESLETLLYCYYFLIMIFRDPQHGFSKNHKISYSLEAITEILFRLEEKIDNNSELWAINTYSIFKRFKKGLYLEAITRIKEINTEQFKAFKNDEAQLDVIKNRLRDDKEKNNELLKCMSRVQNYLAAYKAVKKTEREIRFQKSKAEKQEPTVEQQVLPEPQPQPQTNGVTLNLRKFRERKFQISNASAFVISERDILQQIYEQENLQKQETRKKQKSAQGTKIANNFFLPLMNAAKQSAVADVEKKILNEEWEKLENYSRQELNHAAELVYNNQSKNFHEMIKILDKLGIVDKEKIDIGMLCKIYQEENDIPNSQDLKKMLPFAYLTEPAEKNEDEFKERLYMVMRNSFERLIQGKDNDYIRSLANFIGAVLGNNYYTARFYIDVVILTGKGQLDSETVVRLRILMNILKDYAHEVRVYLTNILQAYRENSSLLIIIKQELLTCLSEIGDESVSKYIQEY